MKTCVCILVAGLIASGCETTPTRIERAPNGLTERTVSEGGKAATIVASKDGASGVTLRHLNGDVDQFTLDLGSRSALWTFERDAAGGWTVRIHSRTDISGGYDVLYIDTNADGLPDDFVRSPGTASKLRGHVQTQLRAEDGTSLGP